MPTIIEDVSKLYGNIAQLENRRLIDHPMERELTLRAIRKALAASPSGPTNPKRIADIGGGPGKLAFLLADEGHHVDLVDLSPDLIQLAQAEQDRRRALHNPNTNTDTTDTITNGSTTTSTTTSTTYTGNNTGTNTNNNKPALLRSISTGNALTLDTHPLLGTNSTPNSNGTYDAVLLLGPLYHLLEEAERATAVTQALRLAKPGGQGVVFVAFVSVAAHLRDVAVREPGRLVERGEFYGKYLTDGRYEKLGPDGMAVQSFHTWPDDIRAFFAKHFADELELVELRSTEGILGGGLDATLAKLGEIGGGDEVVQAWADLMFDHYSTGEQYLGCADHLLATLRRK